MQQLLILHRVDAQLRGLQSRLTTAERQRGIQEQHLTALGVQKQELEGQRRQAQAHNANLEGEANSFDERMERLRQDLNNSTTQKQYAAVLNELNVLKEKRGELDEKMLVEMERIETLGVELEKIEHGMAEREKVRSVSERELEERKAEIGERLDELQKERDEAASAIPEHVLSVFDAIADRYDGEAMAPIDEVNRRHRDYACGECHMQLPFESVARLTSSVTDVVQCGACQRILYLHEETKGALAKK